MSLHSASTARRLDLGFILVVAGAGLVAGYFGSGRPAVGLAMTVLGIAVALVAIRPIMCAVLALPAVYLPITVGLGQALSMSDVFVIAGAFLALPALLGTAELAGLGAMHRAFLLYLALLIPSLLLNPTAEAGQELIHRLVLVSGALLVGAWLVKEHRVQPALRLLCLMGAAFSALAIQTWLTNGYEPAYPLGFHKNYVGSLIALTLLVLLCAPARVSLASNLRLVVIALHIAGVLATQSRGAMLGAALGALLWLFAPRSGRALRNGRTRVAAVLLAVSFATYASLSVQEQLDAENRNTNSAGVRLDVEAYTQELWKSSPLVGIGIRYFNSGDYGRFATASNNAINSELAESGIVGASGFIVFHLAALHMLWRRRGSPLGLTALALVSGQLLHGMVDIYWSSGVTPLPFMLAGMALAEPRAPKREAGGQDDTIGIASVAA